MHVWLRSKQDLVSQAGTPTSSQPCMPIRKLSVYWMFPFIVTRLQTHIPMGCCSTVICRIAIVVNSCQQLSLVGIWQLHVWCIKHTTRRKKSRYLEGHLATCKPVLAKSAIQTSSGKPGGRLSDGKIASCQEARALAPVTAARARPGPPAGVAVPARYRAQHEPPPYRWSCHR